MENDVMLGAGYSTGMFYHAPAGTKLPDGPFETLDKAWIKVGDITSDGISFTADKSTEDLKNWANKIKRTILTDHTESVSAPIMDTTEEVLKTIFGEDNVSTTASTTSHGKFIKVNVSASELPDPEAYLFLMKDGDAGIMLGCEKGQITDLSDVAFQPGAGITWEATFQGLEDGWTMVVDDGTKTA